MCLLLITLNKKLINKTNPNQIIDDLNLNKHYLSKKKKKKIRVLKI
jgi:hypothetical protein